MVSTLIYIIITHLVNEIKRQILMNSKKFRVTN